MSGSCLDVFMEEDYVRDFDEFMDKKMRLLHGSQYKWYGVARTLAIKKTNLLMNGIMKYIFSVIAPLWFQ
jgi:hypothetical protein